MSAKAGCQPGTETFVTSRTIIVAGAGVFGLWQALSLARAGHRVRLLEASPEPFTAASSRLAGAMLLPDCEGEASPAIVRELGRRGVELWRAAPSQHPFHSGEKSPAICCRCKSD